MADLEHAATLPQLSQLQRALDTFASEPCGEDAPWSITVAMKDLGEGLEFRGNYGITMVSTVTRAKGDPIVVPTIYKNLITWFNNELPRVQMGIGRKLKAQYLDRMEGGVQFVGGDKYVWGDAKRYGYDLAHLDETGEVLPWAEFRLCISSRKAIQIGDGGVVVFESRRNCPKVAMMLLYKYFDHDPGSTIVSTEGFPDDDSIFWAPTPTFWPRE